MTVITDNDPLSVAGFFNDKDILLTGASGFLGKVIVHRLLSCCPKIGSIYLLLRAKRNVEPQKRLADLLSASIFDSIPDYQKRKVLTIATGMTLT